MLADRPGTGKSWIGLAVAAALAPGRPVHVIAPSVVNRQWARIAERTGLPIVFHSCELLSRARPPDPVEGAVLIDESHWLRNPNTRRYQTLAPWCVGRRGILLSATPVVNRLEDVIHQLLLLVRDDALAWAGIPSLRRSPRSEIAGELGRLVVTGEDRSERLPARCSRDLRIDDPDDPMLPALQSGIDSLRLSNDPATARLIRVSLLAALASSPQAITEALARYRSLLLHARDAAECGRWLPRQTIRQLVGGELDQLVLWPLVAEPSTAPDLVVSDLELLPALEDRARAGVEHPDPKARALVELLRRRQPTLVFSSARATVHYLRRHLGTGVAWCTGDRAGIDAMGVPREEVLDLLRKPAKREGLAHPLTLVATDIAAEGLDLPLTARVVHYDLPWTAVRLDQRSGRAFRLGSTQQEVEVVRFLPALSLEQALQREAVLLHKANLPSQLGLGDEDHATWKARARIAGEWHDVPVAAGVATVPGPSPGFVAGLRLTLNDGSREEIVLAWNQSDWLADQSGIATLLRLARLHRDGEGDPAAAARGAVRRIAAVMRRRLRTMRGGRLQAAGFDPGLRSLQRRVMVRARDAARQRNAGTLTRLEGTLRLLRRGRTAGEELLLRSWKEAGIDDLLARLPRAGDDRPIPDVQHVELTGLLLISVRDESR